MISFPNAISLGFKNYFDFKGRSTRAEFWWWVLFVVLSDIILDAVDILTGTYNPDTRSGLFGNIFTLMVLVPGLALGARRLHDINRSGLWQLMWLAFFLLIPIVILFWWFAKPSHEGTNQYGPSPSH